MNQGQEENDPRNIFEKVSDPDWRIELIEEMLVPKIDSEFSNVFEREPKEEHVEKAQRILAEELWNEGTGIFTRFAKVMIPLMVIDSIFAMPAIVYGLVFSTTGTIWLWVYTNLFDRHSIASRSEYGTGATLGGGMAFDEEHARRLAHNTVSTNIALAWLAIGFILQIIAVWFFPNQSLIPELI
jgi:hypothetical protein